MTRDVRLRTTPVSAPPLSPFEQRAFEAFRIIQAMYEGALTAAEAMKEWERVRRG